MVITHRASKCESKTSMLTSLPNEIFFLILCQLPSTQLFPILSTCHKFYSLTVEHNNEAFWRCLVYTKYKLSYRHPSLSWYQLAISDTVGQMCPHLDARSHDPWHQPDPDRLLSQLRFVFSHLFKLRHHPAGDPPSGICCSSVYQTFGICLNSGCNVAGCGDVFFEPQKHPGHIYQHHQSTKHSVVLKISDLTFIELWCYACNRPLGYWGSGERNSLPASEEFMVRQWIQYITWSLNTRAMDSSLTAHHYLRRQWEQRLLLSKAQPPRFLLDSRWFYAWVHYLSTPTADPPSFPAQHRLFLKQGLSSANESLINPSLKLNRHFVLVSCQLYCYIQRIYGIDGPTIHKDQLYERHEYKELLKQIESSIDTSNTLASA